MVFCTAGLQEDGFEMQQKNHGGGASCKHIYVLYTINYAKLMHAILVHLQLHST